MCRTDVERQATAALMNLIADMKIALARAYDVDPEDITIGPVDFGPEPCEKGGQW